MIQKPTGKYNIIHKNGSLSDIIKTLLKVDKTPEAIEQTEAVKVDKTKSGLKQLYNYVKSEIRYKLDPRGKQYIKTPSRTYWDGFADCKSLTLFITSVLDNNNIPYIIRFTGYNTDARNQLSHVYPIALIGGQKIILDTVHHTFNEEVQYRNKQDYIKEKFMPEIAVLSGINKQNTPTQGRVIVTPTDTEGELQLKLLIRQAELLKGINPQAADQYNTIIEDFNNALHIGVHGLGNIKTNTAQAKRIIKAAKRKTAAAIGGINQAATRQTCENQIPFEAWRKQNLTVWQRAALGREKELQAWRAAAVDPCVNSSMKSQIINDYMEQSGAGLLYTVIQNSKLTNRALIKKGFESQYLSVLHNVTGVSIANLKQYVTNGTIANAKQTPQGVINAFKAKAGTGTAVGIEPATMILIITAIATAATAIAEAVTASKQLPEWQQQQQQFPTVDNSLLPEPSDYITTGQGGTAATENIKSFLPIAAAGAAAYFILK